MKLLLKLWHAFERWRTAGSQQRRVSLPEIDGQCDDCMYRRFAHDETPCSDCTENSVKVKPTATNSWTKWEGWQANEKGQP